MAKLTTSSPLTAIVYGDGQRLDAVMARVVSLLRAHGHALAGFVQHDAPRPDRPRCDMVLTDLFGGTDIAISEDRGPLARGCRLDLGALSRCDDLCRRALDAGCDMLVVNKFGKAEAEGGGFRPLIAEAVARGVPVLIGVPLRNIEAWRSFADGMAREMTIAELSTDDQEIVSDLGFGPSGAKVSSGSFGTI